MGYVMWRNASRYNINIPITELVCYLNYSPNISGNIPEGMIQIFSLQRPRRHTPRGLLSCTATLPAGGNVVISYSVSNLITSIFTEHLSIDQVLIVSISTDKYLIKPEVITKRANLRGASGFNFKFHSCTINNPRDQQKYFRAFHSRRLNRGEAQPSGTSI